jgi:hypothetical protein
MSGEGSAPAPEATEDDERAARTAMAASVEAVFQAGNAKRKRAEESLEEQRNKSRRHRSCARMRWRRRRN